MPPVSGLGSSRHGLRLVAFFVRHTKHQAYWEAYWETIATSYPLLIFGCLLLMVVCFWVFIIGHGNYPNFNC